MLRTIRNIAIAVIVLLVLIVAGAIIYVMLSGNESDKKASQPKPPAPIESLLPKASKPNPKVPASAAVQSLISPVKAGENTSLTIHTNHGGKCTISLKYGSIAAKDSGLKTKVADDYGIIDWSWTVPKNAPAGTWPIKMYCYYYKKSAYLEANLKVTN